MTGGLGLFSPPSLTGPAEEAGGSCRFCACALNVVFFSVTLRMLRSSGVSSSVSEETVLLSSSSLLTSSSSSSSSSEE